MTQFSIKDLADFSGIKQHTIRIWEQRFDFLKPGRSENLRRRYTTEELNVLLDVSLLNQSGYKVSRIAKMSETEKKQVVTRANHIHQQLRIVNELIVCMAEMDTEKFEMVLDNAMITWGIHETIQQVILPFSERVGLFQKTEVKNYTENLLLVRPLVQQKLHMGIEKAAPAKVLDQSVLLFLPVGEQQEICLVYFNYLLKMQGYRTIYLGRQISVSNLENICTCKRPDFIITQIMDKPVRPDLVRFIEQMDVFNGHSKFITIGTHLPVVKNQQYRKADSAEELIQVLGSL